MPEQFDVVIVGGGLVGASMAAALSEMDISCALIEAISPSGSSQPSFDDRALALSEGSRRILSTLGIWELLDADTVCPIKSIHVSDRGHGGFTRLHASQAGVAALGHVVTARDLGRAMLARLESAGTSLHRYSPATVRSISPKQEVAGIDVEMDNGILDFSASLVILADGGRSGMAAELGIVSRIREYGQHAVVCNVTSDKPHENRAYERFTSNGPLALLPMDDSAPGNRYKMVWTVADDMLDTVLGLEPEAFLSGLQDRFGSRAGRFSQPGKRTSYSMAETRVKTPVTRRVALVGNAAHTTHPVAGQGFNLGLRDVAGLAELIFEARRDGADIGSAQLLEDYRAARKRDVDLIAGITDSLVRVFSNDLLPVVFARNIGLVAVDRVPWLRRGFMRRMMGLSGRQTRLMRGLPLCLDARQR